MLNLDKLKLQIPLNYISLNENKFIIPFNYTRFYTDKKCNPIGLNNAYVNTLSQCLFIELSGKFNAGKNNIGYIRQDNIIETFRKLIRLGYITDINIENVLNKSKVQRVDITKDIESENHQKFISYVEKTCNNSLKYNIQKHTDSSGITITPITKTKETLIIYPKYEEIRLFKNRDYIELLGFEYVEKLKNIIRLEYQLQNPQAIRKNFNIDKGSVSLNQIFESELNPLKTKINEVLK